MKKKLMILLVVVLFITMAFSTGCKKSFDVTGVWTWTLDYGSGWIFSGTVSFAGSKTSGTTTWQIADWPIGIGTYTVSGTSVTAVITWTSNNNTTTCVGTSTDDNTMNGTISENLGSSGNWNASR